MITSSGNQQMKFIAQLNRKAKTRYEQRVFVAEGIKMCLEAPKERIHAMYVSESFLRVPENEAALGGYQYEVVSDPVFRNISDTKTPQGILCLVEMPDYSLEDLLGMEAGRTPHLLLLESIQDPGNLGTMLRTGEGAGITGILMNQTTVDIYNPKTIRGTMGSIYRVPYYVSQDFREDVKKLKTHGISLYAAHLKGTMSYAEPDYTGPAGFFIGNEGNGLTEETTALADTYIHIPMEGKVESLNAAVAATILMYEVKRQRG